MSKHWSTIELVTADTLWQFADEQMELLRVSEESTGDDPAGTIYKLILRGRMEMLDYICKVIMEESILLRDLLVAHDAMTIEEIENSIREYFGYDVS